MKGAAQKIPVGLVVLCRSKHVECAVLLKQKGVVLVDQPAQVRPLGEQGLSVRPPDGEEDLRVVGVPHDRFHGDGHAVVGVAGLDDLGPVLDDLGLRGGGDAKQGGKGRHRGLKGPGGTGDAQDHRRGHRRDQKGFAGLRVPLVRGLTGGQKGIHHGRFLLWGELEPVHLVTICFHEEPSLSNRSFSWVRPRRSWVATVAGLRPKRRAISLEEYPS